jgi:uncharacterized protein YukE
MSMMGTDVLAVACIVGGAAVSGGATLAALQRTQPPRCTAEAMVAPRVMLRMGGYGQDIVVRPRVVAVHRTHGCAAVVVGPDVRVRMDEVRARVEEARARAEEVQARAEEARARAEQVRARAEGATDDEFQAQLQEAMARLERELARLDDGGGGR